MFYKIFGFIPIVHHFTPSLALRISYISLILAVTYGTLHTIIKGYARDTSTDNVQKNVNLSVSLCTQRA